MRNISDFVCIGDLMLEVILPVEAFPEANQTLVIDGKPMEVGGNAFNLCWHLANWGWRPKLVSVFGERQRQLIMGALSSSHIDSSALVPVDGESDLLLVLRRKPDYLAVYIRCLLSAGFDPVFSAHCQQATKMIITGSRHPVIRGRQLAIAQQFHGAILVFSPSYSIYEYSVSELQALLRLANYVALNEHEAAFVCTQLKCLSLADLANLLPGCLIITLAHRGVSIFDHGSTYTIPSFSHTTEDVIGTGDAFLAAFLHALSRPNPVLTAARFASLVAAEVADSSQVRPRVSESSIDLLLATMFPSDS